MSFFKDIKEKLKNPKTRSLTLLGIYVLFFIFVFLVLNSGSETSNYTYEEKKSTIDNFKDMESYQYKITYTNTLSIDIIDGTYYKNTSLYNFNNNKYYFDINNYLIDNDSYYISVIQYNVSKIFNNNIYTIFENLEEISKTTYKNGMIEINYNLDSNIFYKYFYDLDSTYNNTVNVKITEKENYITSIFIDISNLNIDLKQIQIDYSNINNIQNLEFNKENYIYMESRYL